MKLAILLLALDWIGTAQTEQTAQCIFYREGAFTGTALHASIRIDGKSPRRKLGSGRYWATELLPGQHRMYSDLERYARSYQLEAGRTYYFRVELRLNPPTMFGKLRFQIVPIEAEVATSEMAALKPDDRKRH
jgi:hypothetical protein